MRKIKFLILMMTIFISACSATQGSFSCLDKDKHFPSLPDNSKIDVYNSGVPDRPFIKVARLDAHLEKTHFVGSSLKNALPELEMQARHSGSNAIIDINEHTSMLGETRIYHVTAIGIRYSD